MSEIDEINAASIRKRERDLARRRMESAFNATPQGKVVLVSRADLALWLSLPTPKEGADNE